MRCAVSFSVENRDSERFWKLFSEIGGRMLENIRVRLDVGFQSCISTLKAVVLGVFLL